MPMNQTTTRPRTLHHEALAWRKTAMTGVFGRTPSKSTVRAVSKFCRAIDAAGIRSKFLRLNLVCGRNLQSLRTPLYRGASATGTQYGSVYDISAGIVGADYSETTGLTGNGVSKAIDTTLTIGTLKQFGLEYNNVHASVYTRGSNHGDVFGGGDPSNEYYGNFGLLLAAGQDGWWNEDSFSGSNDSRYVASTNSASGHKYGQDNGTMVYYTNGLNTTGVALSPGYPSAYDMADLTPIWFLGRYNNVLVGEVVEESPFYSTGSLAAYSVGLPLGSDAEITAFYHAMQAFQTAMRRQV